MVDNDLTETEKSKIHVLEVQDVLELLHQLREVVEISTYGARQLASSGELIEAVQELQIIEGNPRPAEELEKHRALIKSAMKQVDEGLPLFYSMALINLWSIFDVGFRHQCSLLLEINPEIKKKEAFQKLKIKYGDYEPLSRHEKNYYLIELLEQNLSISQKIGIQRFENILKIMDFPESTSSSEDEKKILELHQLRNSIVHNAGYADYRLITVCPWLKLQYGTKISIQPTQFQEYYITVTQYLTHFIHRLIAYCKTNNLSYKRIKSQKKTQP